MSWRVGSSGEYVDCAAEIRSRAEFEAFVDRLFVLAECQWPTAGDDREDAAEIVGYVDEQRVARAVSEISARDARGGAEAGPALAPSGAGRQRLTSDEARAKRARMLRMKDVEGRSADQIAAVFGISKASVQTQLTTARKEASE